MTCAKIKAAAELYCGASATNDQTLIILNEALAEISDMGLCFSTSTITAIKDTWYNIPSDATFVLNVTDAEGTYYTNYLIQAQKIKFPVDGTFYLTYRRQPVELTTINDTPEVHPVLQNALVTYMKAYLKLRIDDESVDGQNLMNKFQQQVMRAYKILSRRSNNNSSWTVIRHA